VNVNGNADADAHEEPSIPNSVAGR
jgi:hypothetical protein